MTTLINKLVLLITVTSMSSCGTMGESILKDVIYHIDGKEVEVGIEFDNFLDLNLDLLIPVNDYGSIGFSPSRDMSGAILSFFLDLKILKDEKLIESMKKTRKLPNGSKMSSYIETDLLWLKLAKKKRVRPSVYLGTEKTDFYLGVALELEFLDDSFPERLSLSQRFVDSENRPVAVVTLYGPSLKRNGDVKVPGGIFFATNVSDLSRYQREGDALFPGVTALKLEVKKGDKPFEMEDDQLLNLLSLLKKKVEESKNDVEILSE